MRRRLWFYGTLLLLLGGFIAYAMAMPGSSHHGPLPPVTREQRELAERLETHIAWLARNIGERRIDHGDSLARARDYLEGALHDAAAGHAEVQRESTGARGAGAQNLIVELPGSTPEIVLVGAHYDSAPGTPGANDNASGVAATLEVLRAVVATPRKRTLRFVLFANEEPPYFQNSGMGSLVHARGAAERKDPIVAMLALESLGYYATEPGSQKYPGAVALFYPNRGDFVAFVGNLGSRSLVREAIGVFRRSAAFSAEGAALPGAIPGVGWSDHWSFWQVGYSAIMVTDTAVFRDPHYHAEDDLPENLDYERLARVTEGIRHVVLHLSQGRS